MATDKHNLEEGRSLMLDFNKLRKAADCGQAVIPAVVQDIDSREVLVVGYVNDKAFDYTLQHKVATLWSTSRQELWIKGETSGEYLDLVEVRVNCEQNSILYLVQIRGKGACHTRNAAGNPRKSCYYRRVKEDKTLEFVDT